MPSNPNRQRALPTPKILLFDIETAPSLGYFFDRWKEGNIIEVQDDWYTLSFAYKWLGEDKIYVRTLPDFPRYKTKPECDKSLMEELWDLLNESNIVVAHNGDRFDIRRANARFVKHGFIPPSPYQSVDTLKVARKHFKFDSNRLDDLAHFLDVGRKLPHTGARLWLDCMAGSKQAWALMKKYNANDVKLLEEVYIKLKPWTTTHPNLTFYTDREGCPICLSKHTKLDGYRYMSTGKRQRSRCLDCGHWYYIGKLMPYVEDQT